MAPHQSRPFQSPHDLGRHHRVRARVIGKTLLGDFHAQPGQGGQQHELHVGQPEWLQGRPLGRLPGVGDTPELQSGAVVLVGELAGESCHSVIACRISARS